MTEAPRICPECGTPFMPAVRGSVVKKYCSMACTSKSGTKRTKQKREDMAARVDELELENLRLRKMVVKARLTETKVPDSGKEWYRAGGDVVCEICGLVYFDHPEDYAHHWMRVLCNGDRVKL